MKKSVLFLAISLYSFSLGAAISIIDYGADPDSQLNDDTQAIQDAIDANPNEKIIFPAGWYRVTSPIIINHKVELVGEGANDITIFQPSDCHGFVIKKSGVVIKDMLILGRKNSGGLSDGAYYSGIRIDGSKEAATDGSVTNNYIYNCRFENLKILDVAIALELKYAWQTKIDKVDIFKRDYDTLDSLGNTIPNVPQLLYGIRYYGKCVNNTIRDCHITAKTYCIEIKKNPAYDERAEGLMISNCLIASGRSAIFCEGILSLNVTNSILDLCTDYTVHLFNSASVMLTNNWIFSKNRSYLIPIDEAVHMQGCLDVHISNNTLICDTGIRGVSINASANVKILGNTIYMHTAENAESVYIDNSSHKNIIKDNTIRNDTALNSEGNPDIEDYKLPSRIIVHGNNNVIKDNLNSRNYIFGNKNIIQDLSSAIILYGSDNYFECLHSDIYDFGANNINTNMVLGM